MRCSTEQAQKVCSSLQLAEKLLYKLPALQLPLHPPASAVICGFRPGARCRWLVRNDPSEARLSPLGCHGSLELTQVSASHVWSDCAFLASGAGFGVLRRVSGTSTHLTSQGGVLSPRLQVGLQFPAGCLSVLHVCSWSSSQVLKQNRNIKSESRSCEQRGSIE